MALVEGTLAIILYIIVILIIFKLVRSIIKTVLLGLLLVAAAIGVSGFLIISDFNDMRVNLGNSSKAIYLSDGDELLAGFSFTSLDSKNMTFIEIEELEIMEESYRNKKYKSLLNDNYKIFIFDLKVFNDSLEEGIEFELDDSNSFFMNGSRINQSLYSDNPLGLFYDDMFDNIIEQQIRANAIPSELLDNPEMKAKIKEQFFNQLNQTPQMTPGQGRAMVFAMLFKSKMSNSEELGDLYNHYKEGSIKIYKETVIFKLFKYMPKSFFTKVMSLIGNNKNET